jgi:uncharacterized membrane protein
MGKPKNSFPTPSPDPAPTLPASQGSTPSGTRGHPILVARSTFSGPMPPPELVAQYERIVPGAGGFFFSALECQTAHRQALEMRIVEASLRNDRTGMWLGFALAVMLIASGAFLIYKDKDPQGLSMIAGTLVALCGVFVYSRARERKAVAPSTPDPAD